MPDLNSAEAGAGQGGDDGKECRTDRTEAAQAAPEGELRLNTIFTDLNLIEEPRERFGEAGPEPNPGLKKQPEQPRETAGDKTMTTNWKRTETANGAGAYALHSGTFVRPVPGRRVVRSLRWKQDAVCRETASADAASVQTEADSTGSSLTETIFFSSRIQTQPSTRKETQNTNQEKKGKQKQNKVTIRKKLETLA